MKHSVRSSSKEMSSMIKAPEEMPRWAAGRAIAEALAQATPATAFLARLYQFTHPSEMEQAVATWRDEVSDQLNNHEKIIQLLEHKIAPRLQISEIALELALWLSQNSESGLTDPVQYETILSATNCKDKQAMAEACHELEHLGLLKISAAIGHPILRLRPTYELFWAFDPITIDTDPTADAAHIAQMMIDDADFGNIPTLDSALQWSLRRLNPAIARLMLLVADGRTRKEIQNKYPTMGFLVNAEDRFHLKRFVEEQSQKTAD